MIRLILVVPLLLCVQIASAASLCSDVGNAVPIALGTSVVPGDCTGIFPGTLLAQTTSTFDDHVKLAGTLVSAVYLESGGFLDFFYQVTNGTNCSDPPCDPVQALTDNNYAGVFAEVATRTDGAGVPPFVNGDTGPLFADRDLTGAAIEFNFPLGVDQLDPGHTSLVLVITTTAVTYGIGAASVIGSTAEADALGPVTIPEPSSLALLGIGLLVMRGWQRILKAAT